MPLSKLKKKALSQANALMTSERVMGLLADPRVQKAMMSAFQFQAQARQRWEESVTTVAGTLSIATRKDVKKLNRRIKDLERQIKKIQKGDKKK